MRVNNIKDLRNYQKARRLSSHIPHLVLGKNFWSLYLAQKLKGKYGEENIKILVPTHFSLNDLEFKGPTLFRGEENIKALKYCFPHISFPEALNPLFYKDQKLKSVGGRAQLQGLQPAEDFFTQPGLPISRTEILQIDGRKLWEENKSLELCYQLSSLSREKIDQNNRWILSCQDGSQFTCDQLYLTDAPHTIVPLLKKEGNFSNEMLEFCLSSKGPLSLEVEFKSNKIITDHLETLLIPQSQTYDWGHFLGEFSAADKQSNMQSFKFFSFLAEENSDNEEIIKKVKLIKRSLERIFPPMSKAKISEAIFLKKESPHAINGPDFLFESISNSFNDLHFVSWWAPLKKDFLQVKNLQFPSEITLDTRALLSLQQILD